MENAKVRRTKEEWLKLVEEYRKSGQVLSRWCEEHGINHKTMSGYTHMKPALSTKRSEQEWIMLIAKQKASEMSREGWCRENNINPNSMLSAEKRLNAKRAADIETESRVLANKKQASNELDKGKLKWIEVNAVSSSESTVGFNAVSPVESRNSELGTTLLTESEDSSDAAPSSDAKAEVMQAQKPSSVPAREPADATHPVFPQEKLLRPIVLIRSNGIEIEADADYPVGHLTALIGGLMRC